MSNECSKAVMRRLYQPGFINRYFVGDGIDIGAGADGLGKYKAQFPLMRSCRHWDVPDGDAQHMRGVENSSYDFVASHHCLEHVVDPYEAITNWFRILRPGGHLVVLVPDQRLYEHGKWPSQYNVDHKHSFTIHEAVPLHDGVSVNVFDLIGWLGTKATPIKIELLEHTYDYSVSGVDQTRGLSESAIEFIVRKES